jgi:Sec-independent protein translocase protein TatA
VSIIIIGTIILVLIAIIVILFFGLKYSVENNSKLKKEIRGYRKELDFYKSLLERAKNNEEIKE